MDNSVDRKNAIRLYLTGTIGQITVIAVIVYLLRRMGIVVDYTTVIGNDSNWNWWNIFCNVGEYCHSSISKNKF
jgi:hypothetical protein